MLHDELTDANVRSTGTPDELPGYNDWLDEHGDGELSGIELDYLAAKDEAERNGWGVYLVVATNDDYKIVAAPNEAAAFRTATAHGWQAEQADTIAVEEVTPPPPFVDFELEVLESKGWVLLGPQRARSAAQAVAIAQLAHPDWNIRAVSLFSRQAHRLIDRTAAAA